MVESLLPHGYDASIPMHYFNKMNLVFKKYDSIVSQVLPETISGVLAMLWMEIGKLLMKVWVLQVEGKFVYGPQRTPLFDQFLWCWRPIYLFCINYSQSRLPTTAR